MSQTPSVRHACPACEEHEVEVAPWNRLRRDEPTETLSQLNERQRGVYREMVVRALLPHFRAEHQDVQDPEAAIRAAKGWTSVQ